MGSERGEWGVGSGEWGVGSGEWGVGNWEEPMLELGEIRLGERRAN